MHSLNRNIDPNTLNETTFIETGLRMIDTYYCYEIGYSTPLLTDAEWEEIEPIFRKYMMGRSQYDRIYNCSKDEGCWKAPSGLQALDIYTNITGAKLKHPDHLMFVQFSRYGSLCPKCDRPFRTARAKMCAACGYELPAGHIAGRLRPREM